MDINPQQPLFETADPPRLANVMLHIAFGMKVQDLWGCHSSCFQHSSHQLGCFKISQDQFVKSQPLGTHAEDVSQRPLGVSDRRILTFQVGPKLPHPTCPQDPRIIRNGQLHKSLLEQLLRPVQWAAWWCGFHLHKELKKPI